MSWHYLTIAFAVGLFLFDFQNLASWWNGRKLSTSTRETDDFTIVIPLYNHPRFFDGREALLPYQQNVLVAIDVGNELMASFSTQLEQEGWRVSRMVCQNPGPPVLVKLALKDVHTAYVVRMDADSLVGGDLRAAVGSMLADDAELCSVKVLASNASHGFVTKFQALEYRMAMLSRHFRPWLASGACFIAKTESLRTILGLHTMNYLGEDVETGRIALALRMRVRHLDIVVKTDVPTTWVALFKQRRLWWAGNFRHAVLNMDKNLIQTPTWAFYYLALVWCGVSFKVWFLVPAMFNPAVLLYSLFSLFLLYALVTVIANWQVRSWWMVIFPPYALLQSILMPPVGLFWFFVMYRRSGNLGRYRFPYRRKVVVV